MLSLPGNRNSALRETSLTIDIHNHIWTREYLSDHWWDIYSNFFSTYITDSPFSGTPEEIDRNLFAKCFDPDGSECIAEMDEAGIDVAVVTAIDGSCALGEGAQVNRGAEPGVGPNLRRLPGPVHLLLVHRPTGPGGAGVRRALRRGVGCQGIQVSPQHERPVSRGTRRHTRYTNGSRP